MTTETDLRTRWDCLRAQVEVAHTLTERYATNGCPLRALYTHPDFSGPELLRALDALVAAGIARVQWFGGWARLDESPLVFRRVDLLAARCHLARLRWSVTGLTDPEGLYAEGTAACVGEVARLEGELAAEEARARAPT